MIALSIHILRAGVARSGSGRIDGIEVRLALRCLLHHCPERWPLEQYWDAAAQENEIPLLHSPSKLNLGRRPGRLAPHHVERKLRGYLLFPWTRTRDVLKNGLRCEREKSVGIA